MTINARRALYVAAVVAGWILLPGCASVSVKEDKWAPERLALPKRVYVADYEVPADVLAVGRSGEDLEEFRKAKVENFSAELCERISKRIAPAVPPIITASRSWRSRISSRWSTQRRHVFDA